MFLPRPTKNVESNNRCHLKNLTKYCVREILEMLLESINGLTTRAFHPLVTFLQNPLIIEKVGFGYT